MPKDLRCNRKNLQVLRVSHDTTSGSVGCTGNNSDGYLCLAAVRLTGGRKEASPDMQPQKERSTNAWEALLAGPGATFLAVRPRIVPCHGARERWQCCC